MKVIEDGHPESWPNVRIKGHFRLPRDIKASFHLKGFPSKWFHEAEGVSVFLYFERQNKEGYLDAIGSYEFPSCVSANLLRDALVPWDYLFADMADTHARVRDSLIEWLANDGSSLVFKNGNEIYGDANHLVVEASIPLKQGATWSDVLTIPLEELFGLDVLRPKIKQ